jgi:acyl-CoA reductase-like NAD-dependent aldehyde dehydrogenase
MSAQAPATRIPAAPAAVEVGSRIGDQAAARGSQGTFDDLNPAYPSEVVARVAECGPDDVAAAVGAAVAMAEEWRSVSPVTRGEILFAAARLLRDEAESVARLESREMGKPITESRGEVAAAIGFLEYFAGEAIRLSGDVTASVRDRVKLLSLREPIGVLGLVTPWNFPISIPTKKMSAALAFGNAAVLKPASRAPAVSARVVQLLLEAGVPSGVINFVPGGGESAGSALINDPRVSAVSFTGSTAVGWQTVATATARHGSVQAEMGGKNAAVVWDDCDLDRAVSLVVDGAFRSAGQKCTSTSRVIVHAGVRDRFVEALLTATQAVSVGDPLAESTFMGPLVDGEQLNRVEHYVNAGRSEGASLLAGGRRVHPPGMEDGYFFAPTVFGDVQPEMTIAQEEIFGPVLALMTCDSLDEAVDITNGTMYGLAAVIHTASVARSEEFIRRVDVGCAGVNVTTAGWEAQAPFGGTKSSGYGIREQGPGAVDFFTRRKTVAASA